MNEDTKIIKGESITVETKDNDTHVIENTVLITPSGYIDSTRGKITMRGNCKLTMKDGCLSLTTGGDKDD